MNSASVQSYIRTVTTEENPVIEAALNRIRAEAAPVTVGLAANIGQRDYQQDASFGDVYGTTGFGVVCDGMGGLEGGERASQTAVSMLIEDYYAEDRISDIDTFFNQEAYKLNDAVCELRGADGASMHAGTTIVAVQIEQNLLSWLSVGDSRIYLLRGNTISQLNREHTYRATLDARLALGEISNAEYLAEEGQAEALTSFLGVGKLKLIDQNMEKKELREGDAILLCSDGLYKGLSDELILGIAQTALPDTQLAARRLVEGVLQKNIRQQDNVSVVLLQYHSR